MTDTEKKIAEIRGALEKATQGPWKWVDPGGLERKKLVGEWEIMNFGIGGAYDQVAGSEPDEDDAHLIANAPEWIRFLLDELDRLRAENEQYRKALERIAETDIPYAPMTDHSVMRFYEQVAREALTSTQTEPNKLRRIEK